MISWDVAARAQPERLTTMPLSQIPHMQASQLRGMLFDIMERHDDGDWGITCATEAEALGLINRLNVIRAKERKNRLKEARADNARLDALGKVTELDRFVFRRRGARVILTLSPWGDDLAYQALMEENGREPVRAPIIERSEAAPEVVPKNQPLSIADEEFAKPGSLI